MTAKYICVEGTDGVGKTTQVQLLGQRLTQLAIPHVLTSEPGNPHLGLTMQLRSLMLDAKWSSDMTPLAREYLFQATRSMNLDKVVYPALQEGKVVISDRGILSGMAYNRASDDFDSETTKQLFKTTTANFCRLTGKPKSYIYDLIIILKEANVQASLSKARDKHEFKQGDVIENQGVPYMDKVRHYMKPEFAQYIFECPIVVIDVNGKSREQVNNEIFAVLKEKGLIIIIE